MLYLIPQYFYDIVVASLNQFKSILQLLNTLFEEKSTNPEFYINEPFCQYAFFIEHNSVNWLFQEAKNSFEVPLLSSLFALKCVLLSFCCRKHL